MDKKKNILRIYKEAILMKDVEFENYCSVIFETYGENSIVQDFIKKVKKRRKELSHT